MNTQVQDRCMVGFTGETAIRFSHALSYLFEVETVTAEQKLWIGRCYHRNHDHSRVIFLFHPNEPGEQDRVEWLRQQIGEELPAAAQAAGVYTDSADQVFQTIADNFRWAGERAFGTPTTTTIPAA